MFKLVIFVGTARNDSKTKKVVDFVTSFVSENINFEFTVINPRDLDLKLNDEARGSLFPEIRKMVGEADAYIIVAPEYNHGYSAGLKFILDLNLKEYFNKPVGLIGVSSGPFGGTRVIQQLIQVVRRLGMIPTRSDLHISDVKNELDEDGKMVDPEKFKKRAEIMINELIWLTKALKNARELDQKMVEV